MNIIPPSDKTDVFVVNTCTVTAKSDYQARQMIRRFRRMNPEGIIVVTGCYAQVDPDGLKGLGVDYVLGNMEKVSLWEMVKAGRKGDSPEIKVGDVREADRLSPYYSTGITDRTRAYLKLQDGCDAFCSYCIVPYARGRGRSLPVEDVLSGIDRLIDKGFKEIVLTGVDLGRYGEESGDGLVNLLRIIEERYGCVSDGDTRMRFRLSSIEPMYIKDGLIDIISRSGIICRHLHIPVQSGSDRILSAMNRPYSSEDFSRLITGIHDLMPDISIGTDIIAGFPGEGEDDFEATYRLISELPLSYLHVFPFSRRKGTPAAVMPVQVNGSVIRERCRRLRALGIEKRFTFYKENIGREEFVLVENHRDRETGLLKGYSGKYIPVLIDGDDMLMGRLISIRIDSLREDKVVGIVEGSQYDRR